MSKFLINFFQKILLFLLPVLFLVSKFSLADFSLTQWPFEKQINIPSVNQPSYFELIFDNEVYSQAMHDLRDLRVIDAKGNEVPYQLVIKRGGVEYDFLKANIFNKSFIPGQYTFFMVDLGKAGILHNRVKININSINFRRQVKIEASNDAQNWSVIETKAIIYDYTDTEANLKANNTLINYPEGTWRYLKITIFDQGEEPLDIIDVNVFYEKIEVARTIAYPAEIVEKFLDKNNVSNYVIDLKTKGLPTKSLILLVDSSNFQREVALDGSDDKINWSPIVYRTVIFSFETPKFVGSNLTINYPESFYRYLRLRIFNRDNQPIVLNNISVSGILRTLVFYADPNLTYKLYYGNNLAFKPQYDLDRYFDYLDLKSLPVASLGKQIKNPYFKEILSPPSPLSERFPWLFPLVLLFVGFILGLTVVRLFRKVKGEQTLSD